MDMHLVGWPEDGMLFRLLAQTCPAAVLIHRGQRILFANETAATLTGWDARSLIGMNVGDLIHPDYRPRVLQRAQARERGEPVPARYQFKIVTETGQERWVDFSAASFLMDGEPAGMDVMVDITDSRRGDAVLLETEHRYADIFENSVEGIYQCDTRGRLLGANPSFARILGYPSTVELAAAVASVPLQVFCESERHAELASALSDEGSVRGFAAQMRRTDGRSIAVILSANAVFDERLSLLSYTAFLQDVTEQRLLERRLAQAQKMEAIGRLAGGIAHDFNNILTVLMGYSESLLSLLPEGHDGARDALEIKNAARRAAMLTQQLLAFGRRQAIQPVVMDVAIVVHGMEAMLRRLIGEDIELTIERPREPCWARADPHQVEQVVMNLVLNARDAMPRGGSVRIVLSRREVSSGAEASVLAPRQGRFVEVEVVDTGIGMTQEVVAQIFEPFFTTKPQGQGTGLGLSTVYGIIEQTGGFITVDSEPGRGSSFKVCFPGAEEPHGAALPLPALLRCRGGAERILVVEDDPVVRAVTVGICLAAGYQVSEAADGVEGCSMVSGAEGGFDLIITDVVMPRMGGRELACAVQERFPRIGVLFVSGHMGVESDAGGSPAEGGFLAKPFTREELLLKIEEALGGQARGGGEARHEGRARGAAVEMGERVPTSP